MKQAKACIKKKCKGNKECDMNGSFGLMMDGDAYSPDKKCASFEEKQKNNCECVKKDEFDLGMRKRVKSFYEVFQKSKLEDIKLDKKGEITSEYMEKTIY